MSLPHPVEPATAPDTTASPVLTAPTRRLRLLPPPPATQPELAPPAGTWTPIRATPLQPPALRLDFSGVRPPRPPQPDDTIGFAFGQCPGCLDGNHAWYGPGTETTKAGDLQRYRCNCDTCFGRCDGRQTRITPPAPHPDTNATQTTPRHSATPRIPPREPPPRPQPRKP